MTNPILKYPGAKWRLARWIISHMPPHVGYLEPFAGSLAVLFNKKPSRLETVNDIDSQICGFFRTCREQPEELAAALEFTPWSREEYKRSCDDNSGLDSVEAARMFLVRCWQAFGGTTGQKTGWANTTGKTSNVGGVNKPRSWRRLPDIVYQAAERLALVQIENAPAIDVIHRLDGPEMLIYADPPYLHTERTNAKLYKHEMTRANHMELLSILINCKSMVLLSGYDSDLYNDMLAGWAKSSIRAQAEGGATRTECLWLNPAAIEKGVQTRMEGVI